jgi:hypothetical protein
MTSHTAPGSSRPSTTRCLRLRLRCRSDPRPDVGASPASSPGYVGALPGASGDSTPPANSWHQELRLLMLPPGPMTLASGGPMKVASDIPPPHATNDSAKNIPQESSPRPSRMLRVQHGTCHAGIPRRPVGDPTVAIRVGECDTGVGPGRRPSQGATSSETPSVSGEPAEGEHLGRGARAIRTTCELHRVRRRAEANAVTFRARASHLVVGAATYFVPVIRARTAYGAAAPAARWGASGRACIADCGWCGLCGCCGLCW